MNTEIDLLEHTARSRPNYTQRGSLKTAEVIETAKKFDYEFFDGDRCYGLGGYRYDGSWLRVAERMISRYKLQPDCHILDIGCAKGFLLHDFKLLMPECTISGLDISEYAIRRSMKDIQSYLNIGNAINLPYADKSFDLVTSTNTLHNLTRGQVRKALQEISRVCRGDAYISVAAWRNENERDNLKKWTVTAETMMHVNDWKVFFQEAGYAGDYGWFIAPD